MGGGPAGVGNAVNETVVFTFVALFVINIIVTAVGIKVTVHEVSAMTQAVPSKPYPRLRRASDGVDGEWNRIGTQAQFYAKTLGSIGDAVVHYRTELCG